MSSTETPLVFRNYIHGEWREARGGKAFENRNPANTDELIGMFPSSSQEDVDIAVQAAEDAYDRWRLVPAPRRAEILYRAAELLVRRKEELARDMTREMGKILTETRGDVQEAIDMTYYMAGEGRRQFGQTTPSELPNKFAMTVRAPLGVAGLITPWNFPMAIPSWKIMPALVCGNTVVIKPAEDTPLSAYNLRASTGRSRVAARRREYRDGRRAWRPVRRWSLIRACTSSASRARRDVGRMVSAACAPTFKKCTLEMGGKNIIIVMDDANLDLAVEGAVWGGFGTSGQRCTAASRVAVHTKIYSEFMDRFVERTRALRVGDGSTRTTDMGPLMNETQLKKVMEYVEIGKERRREAR